MGQHKKILLSLLIVSVVVITIFGLWKLHNGLYNALDLAIYSQTAWNTFHGDFLYNSIQGTNYFADHFEPLFLVVAAIYNIFAHPLTLVLLQAIVLMSACIPLYKIARQYLSPRVALIIGILYIFCPLIWNVALFEFHMLVFAIPFLFWMLYAYVQQKFSLYWITGLVALCVREDVALAIFGMGMLALVERKKVKWWLAPMLGSVIWFIASITISQKLAGAGYKFSIYYSWLGENVSEIFTTLITHPGYVLIHVLSINNILFLVSLLLLFLCIPLFGAKGLLPAILIFLQLLLGLFNTKILLGTHYTALLVPFLFFATILGIKKLQACPRVQLFPKMHTSLLFVIIGVIALFNFIALGPLRGVASQTDTTWNGAGGILDELPPNASVVASYAFLPSLTNRSKLYSLHYIALGHKQFSDEPYILEPLPEYVALDLSDLTSFEFQFLNKKQFEQDAKKLPQNLREFLSSYEVTKRFENTLLLQKKSTTDGAEVGFTDSEITPTEQVVSVESTFFAELIPENSETPIQISEWESAQTGEFLKIIFSSIVLPTQEWNNLAIQINAEDWTSPAIIPFAWHLFAQQDINESKSLIMRVPINSRSQLGVYTIEIIERSGYVGLANHRGSRIVTENKHILSSNLITVTQTDLKD